MNPYDNPVTIRKVSLPRCRKIYVFDPKCGRMVEKPRNNEIQKLTPAEADCATVTEVAELVNRARARAADFQAKVKNASL